jgi:hypothetical protein
VSSPDDHKLADQKSGEAAGKAHGQGPAQSNGPASFPPVDATSSSAIRAPQTTATVEPGEHGHGKTGRPKTQKAPPLSGAAPGDPHHAPHLGGRAHAGGLGSELPETYGVDEVEILCKDPWWYFAYWEVTQAGLEAAREQLGPSGKDAKLILRVFSSGGDAGGQQPGGKGRGDGRGLRDVPVQSHHGRRYLEAPRQNALLRVAIGLLSTEGYFAPIAHSSVVRVPPQHASSETSVEWLHVLPARGDGRQREHIAIGGLRPTHEERPLPWRTGGAAGDGATITYPSPTEAGGSSSLGVQGTGGTGGAGGSKT